jgi:hypothetical protein
MTKAFYSEIDYTIEDVRNLANWAKVICRVSKGWMCFDTVKSFVMWKAENQQEAQSW